MMIQQDVKGSKFKATLNQDNASDTMVTFIKFWPSVMYPVQNMTSHGAYFEAVPSVKSSGSESAKVEKVWQLFEKVDMRAADGHGWILVYLTKNCFNQGRRRQMKGGIFKYVLIKNVRQLFAKVHFNCLEDAFINVEEVLSYKGNREYQYNRGQQRPKESFIGLSQDVAGMYNIAIYI
eukprot:15364604-Ditylum_brightwellii.AAC.1